MVVQCQVVQICLVQAVVKSSMTMFLYEQLLDFVLKNYIFTSGGAVVCELTSMLLRYLCERRCVFRRHWASNDVSGQ